MMKKVLSLILAVLISTPVFAERTMFQTFNIAPGATAQGDIVFSKAAARIIPGATSLTFRNNANSTDNLAVADNGVVTFRSKIAWNASEARLVGGTTGFGVTNNSEAAYNLLITDAGLTTLRNTLTLSSGNVIMSQSGATISIQENTASTACLGVVTPNGTTPVAVTTSCATSGARVIYSRNGAITNVGTVTTTTAPSGTGFSFASTNASDTTTSVVWFIIKESA